MKILLVGSDKVFAIEIFYVKYLREMGVDVCSFPSHRYFYDYYDKSLLNKVLFKLGLSNIYRKVNKLYKEAVLDYKPDIIWVFKGMEIYPETLRWTRKLHYKLINYNPDNPFLFSSRGSGNSNITNSIGLYDRHVTYHTDVKARIEKDFKIPTDMIYFGYDISDELYEQSIKQPEVIRACFVGNPDKLRAAFLQKIAEAGIKIDVYGNDWKKFIRHPNFEIFPPVYEDSLGLILRKYRVQINMMRPHNPQSHNMRTFEVPGVGGILLGPDNPDHRSFFDVNKEIFLYKDLDDCIVQLKKILAMPLEEANEVRRVARKRSIESGYTYKERTVEIYDILKKLA